MPAIKKLTCKSCGKLYDGCKTCEAQRGKIHMWRQVACSQSCYQDYIAKVMEGRGGDAVALTSPSTEEVTMYKLRGYLNKENRVRDIADYSVKGGELEFAVSAKASHKLDEFEYLIIPVSELKSLVSEMGKIREKPKRGKPEKDNELIEMAVVEE